MAFFDKVTSSVQRFTRRVGGGGGTHAATGSSHSTAAGLDDRSDDGDTDCPTSVHETVEGESSRMDKRIQKGSSSSKSSRNDEWRRRESELNETFRRKLDSMRQRWQAEKSKELDALVATLKKRHDIELEATLKNKEKEMKVLRTQLQKSQEQLIGRSRSGPLMNSASQDSIKSSRSQGTWSSYGAIRHLQIPDQG